ncbi:ABC transporter permease [Actinoplanes sp. NBRC 101535]|uniref:ABC transporter permease n=1 Tax=Actinoplanes sp. NBRC 101535 TaxID=3032196 RepID=UPI0024A083BE|nr:ABC transporter permease [Actinoplanes sp. NBRC 101535]GLY08732.1 hypothetical protein Acsp01_91110 [Actinoplanes sp. NBRC 101535]
MAVHPEVTVRAPVRRHRPAALAALTGHALLGTVRNPIGLFFTVAFPLTFLVILASIIGDQQTGQGVPTAQFLVAPFAVFGVAQAAFVLLAVDMTGLRERGVLLRMRATPIPAWTVPASRITAAAATSVVTVLLLAAVGVAAFDVQIFWGKVPAMLVTLLLGTACCAALGLAMASLARSVAVAQSLGQGLLVSLAYISDVFIVGADLPRWMDVLGSALPLKHFARAMAATFDPATGSAFAPAHLAVLAVWTVAGMIVAGLRFGWAPRGIATLRPAAATPETATTERLSPPAEHRRSALSTVAGQIGYSLLGLRRNLMSVFFSLVFPVLLLVLFPAVFGDSRVHGMSLAQYLFAGMIAYTAALNGFVDVSEAVVVARSTGVLKRLRGTPLSLRWYFAGRTGAAALVSLTVAILLTATGVVFLDVRVDAARSPALLVAVVAGSLCFTALGLAIAALMPSARSIIAVTLGTLLPLCFASEIFVVGDQPLPGWLATVAGVLPLRHLLLAVLTATDPAVAGAGFAPGHLAVLAGWTVAGLLVLRSRQAALS